MKETEKEKKRCPCARKREADGRKLVLKTSNFGKWKDACTEHWMNCKEKFAGRPGDGRMPL